MSDDTATKVKIKLSLKDLIKNTADAPKESNSLQEMEKAAAQLKLTSTLNPNPVILPAEPVKKDSEPILQQDQNDEKTKISLKNHALQGIKPKISLKREAPSVKTTQIPSYEKNNIPNSDELNAKSLMLKIPSEAKGDTQKIVEIQPTKNPIIDLNALNIKLDGEPPVKGLSPIEDNASHSSESDNAQNIDFEAQSPNIKRNLSDTVKLKIKPATPSGKVFNNIVKKNLEEPPPVSPVSKGKEIKPQDSFTIPKNVLHPDSFSSINTDKKKPHWVIMGILGILLVLIIYSMIITIKTLSTT